MAWPFHPKNTLLEELGLCNQCDFRAMAHLGKTYSYKMKGGLIGPRSYIAELCHFINF